MVIGLRVDTALPILDKEASLLNEPLPTCTLMVKKAY